jgi:hypothetical protein
MAHRKTRKKEEKSYSYEQFLKTFYPKPRGEGEPLPRDPKVFGSRLAEAALKKLKAPSSSEGNS